MQETIIPGAVDDTDPDDDHWPTVLESQRNLLPEKLTLSVMGDGCRDFVFLAAAAVARWTAGGQARQVDNFRRKPLPFQSLKKTCCPSLVYSIIVSRFNRFRQCREVKDIIQVSREIWDREKISMEDSDGEPF